MALMVSCGKGKAVFVLTMMAYRGNGGTAPLALYQRKLTSVPLNMRLNVPESQSGCYGEGINPLSLLRIE